jgi:hypothetical protein
MRSLTLAEIMYHYHCAALQIMKPLLRRLISMTGVQLSDSCRAALDIDERPAGFEFLTDDIFSIEPVVKKTHLSMRSLGRMHMALAKVSAYCVLCLSVFVCI